MKENVNLIKEINDLQRERKNLKDDVAKKQSIIAANLLKKKYAGNNTAEEFQLVISAQNEEMKYLQEQLKEVSQKNQMLKEKRPPSGSKNFFLFENKFF